MNFCGVFFRLVISGGYWRVLWLVDCSIDLFLDQCSIWSRTLCFPLLSSDHTISWTGYCTQHYQDGRLEPTWTCPLVQEISLISSRGRYLKLRILFKMMLVFFSDMLPLTVEGRKHSTYVRVLQVWGLCTGTEFHGKIQAFYTQAFCVAQNTWAM